MADALSIVEAARLENLEEVISHGLQSFVDVGRSLAEIRDGRLYRQSHDTFEDYCRAKWSIERAHAYRLVEAAEVVDRLSPTGDILPVNERQARPLTQLPPDEQAEAWQEAVDTAPAGKVTAAHVADVVERRTKPTPITGPLVVNVAEESKQISSLADLAGQKFGTIYADPPWQYGNQATRAATSNHYETMNVDALCEMPVADLAADDAHLHLWTTNAFLPDSFRVLEAWGFEYRSVFVWVKPQMGIGNYWRVSHEFLLLGIRGDAKRFNQRNRMSWGQFSRGQHSAKPDEIRDLIQQVSPGPFLELFGRKPANGWTVFGNQVERRLIPA